MARTFLFLVLVAATTSAFSHQVTRSGIHYFRGHPIAYEVAECTQSQDAGASMATHANTNHTKTAPLLLLNGFGVGSFHQHRLIEAMSNNSTIYTMDYLGQGKSWPLDCCDGQGPNEQGLRYCGNTWVAQIIDFLEQVVQTPVHIVGNSVGGHLAVFVAASRPDLVSSLTLLNPTPVWGLNLPGWSGHLPAPFVPRLMGRYLFDRIRDWTTIEKYLSTAYANRNAFDDNLIHAIRQCTEGTGGHVAFASILWSPPIAVPTKNFNQATFYDCLSDLECDVLLVFGAKDPWCKPIFGQRMLQVLQQRRKQQQHDDDNHHHHSVYVTLSDVGHCPNHEAPSAVAALVQDWLSRPDDRRQSWTMMPSWVKESWGITYVQPCRVDDSIPTSWMDRLALALVS